MPCFSVWLDSPFPFFHSLCFWGIINHLQLWQLDFTPLMVLVDLTAVSTWCHERKMFFPQEDVVFHNMTAQNKCYEVNCVDVLLCRCLMILYVSRGSLFLVILLICSLGRLKDIWVLVVLTLTFVSVHFYRHPLIKKNHWRLFQDKHDTRTT